MARITVEDCLDNVDNRFQLVLKASQRARDLAISGKDPLVAWENDKPTVVALREIAGGLLAEEQPEAPVDHEANAEALAAVLMAEAEATETPPTSDDTATD